MTLEQGFAFGIVGGLMVLFVWNKIRYDLAALLGLIVAIASGIVPVDKAFVGFSDQVVIIVASALVVSAGVGKSSVISRFIRRAESVTTTSGARVALLSSAVAILSSFVKNIGALAIFLPVALQISRRSGTPASTLLMPMAFGSLIGGIVTLVGTSPNILVSRVREEVLGKPFGMFDFAPVGLGIPVGRPRVPGIRLAAPAGADAARLRLEDTFKVDAYVAEATLPKTSKLVNRSVDGARELGRGQRLRDQHHSRKRARYVPAGIGRCLQKTPWFCRAMRMPSASWSRRRAWSGRRGAKPPTPEPSAEELAVVEAVIMAGSSSSAARPPICVCAIASASTWWRSAGAACPATRACATSASGSATC